MDKTTDVLSGINYKSFYTRHIPGFNPNGKTEVQCLCPFHDDTNPSLSVNLKKGLFRCFGCGVSGGVVKFIELRYGLDKKAALEKIKEEEGNPPPTPASGGHSKTKTHNSKPAYLTLDQVKLIHNQLMKNAAGLKTFQDKYGLSRETIEKYLIGYQFDDGKKEYCYVVPREIEPGKWILKNHKGGQSFGAKASLYPFDVVKEDLPYILICEGEFKALLLNQLGFPAISVTSGACTWRQEWSSFFTNLNVIIAYDNDEPGRQGALKVAEFLKGTARSVKQILWPSCMDSKDKKDVTDFFITLGKTKEDFRGLIAGAKEIACDLQEIDGVRFIEPAGFKVYYDRVEQIIYYENKQIQKPAFYTPLFITGRALDIDFGIEDVEITFKRDHKWKKIWISKLLISDAKKIIELANHGLPVNSRNSGKMIEYLAAFEAFNMSFIPKSFTSKSFGFKSVGDKLVFILEKMVGKKAVQGDKEVSVEFFTEPGFERFVKAVKPEGTYAKWRECIGHALKYPYANLAFYASFAAPLLRILKAPNFIVDFWGNTSVGKTTVLELAASVWGNPHREAGGLIFGWDSTRTFLERIATFFCDMPIFPDDSQTVSKLTLSNNIYMLINGCAKGRANIVGVRHTSSWHTIVFSTGERPISESSNDGGGVARLISLYGSPFPNAGSDFINDLKTGLRKNYGHAGAKFVEGILPILESTDKTAKLQIAYETYKRTLSLEANNEVGDRISQYFAVIKLAADLVYEILGVGDPVAARESIDRVFENVIRESLNDVDVGTRAMEYILSWANANEASFKGNTTKSFGKWKEFEYLGIYKSELANALREENFSERVVLRLWSEKEWIKREDDKFTCVRDGKRLVIIPWNVITEFTNK